MKEQDIRKYARLMEELGLTGLEINVDGAEVRLERNPAHPAEGLHTAPAAAPPSPETELSRASGEHVSIKSPIVGVFYSAPAENAQPFVSAGDRVEKGQTLCIIEAMKLMNEVTAEEAGIVSEICVRNGQVVEYGTELFRIKR